MAEVPPPAWAEEEEAPQPAENVVPPGWTAPVPVETTFEAPPGVTVQEEADLRRQRFNRKKRFWITTVVFLLLWALSVKFIDTGGNILVLLVPLLPMYLITLAFALRAPKGVKPAKRSADRLSFQYKLMIALAVFLAVYIPFTFVSNSVIPNAPLFEYVLFALLLFLLFRLAGRSTGVAPSLDALPPPSHRLHQQVVAPIDDAHYQQNLWLNYNFVERGRGSKTLARRIDEILEDNGVSPARRSQLLAPLETYPEEGGFWFTRSGRERRAAGRENRIQLLDGVFHQLSRELEQ